MENEHDARELPAGEPGQTRSPGGEGRGPAAPMPRQQRSGRHPDPVLAALLKQLREERGITQEDLAFDAGITTSALSQIERGLNRPGWETVMRLVQVLGMSLMEFGAHLDEALMSP